MGARGIIFVRKICVFLALPRAVATVDIWQERVFLLLLDCPRTKGGQDRLGRAGFVCFLSDLIAGLGREIQNADYIALWPSEGPSGNGGEFLMDEEGFQSCSESRGKYLCLK